MTFVWKETASRRSGVKELDEVLELLN